MTDEYAFESLSVVPEPRPTLIIAGGKVYWVNRDEVVEVDADIEGLVFVWDLWFGDEDN